ncbi:MAG: GNAT family N-acetyltransferase [bacterium]
MGKENGNTRLEPFREKYPEKFIPEERIFGNINRGGTIFIGTGCGEPMYLVSRMIEYVKSNPKAFFDTEVIHVWALGIAPYTDARFSHNFRLNSFYVGNNTRGPVNQGLADYTPIFLSQVPKLFHKKHVPVDVALIQTSMPDEKGYLSLGISVDITKAAVENASVVIAQVNSEMPRVHGDAFIHIEEVDYIVHHNEPVHEYFTKVDGEIAEKIGNYVARIVRDGDVIQVGYGGVPNAILPCLKTKKHLGVHTELFTDGIAELMREGVVDNSQKSINRGKAIAAFCIGGGETYRFLDDNPSVHFRTTDYVNDPLVIAQNENMVAINSALQVDLTGQATSESIGKTFFSGIGGSADFMRGALMAPGGRSILVLQSTAKDGEVSRIVPFLDEGAGVTHTRGDIHYVITEYGIAYLHGKNIRERAMDLISLAHPKFRPRLIEEAKKLNLIYKDQKFISGKEGEYPEELETHRKTGAGVDIFLRPVKISDEPLIKDFFYSLSDDSIYKRFMSSRRYMPHNLLQRFVVIDYTREMVILAVLQNEEMEEIVGIAQYCMNQGAHTAEVALVVRDDFHNQGIGTELMYYLTYLALNRGLLGFTAEVLAENDPMLHVFEKIGFGVRKKISAGTCELQMSFRG